MASSSTHRTWLSSTVKHGILEASHRTPIAVATAADSGGPGDGWTPEELLVGALETCMTASFHALARQSGLGHFRTSSTCAGTVQRGSRSAFTEIHVCLNVVVGAESERALAGKLAERAGAACTIANSLGCPVHVDYTVVVADAPR